MSCNSTCMLQNFCAIFVTQDTTEALSFSKAKFFIGLPSSQMATSMPEGFLFEVRSLRSLWKKTSAQERVPRGGASVERASDKSAASRPATETSPLAKFAWTVPSAVNKSLLHSLARRESGREPSSPSTLKASSSLWCSHRRRHGLHEDVGRPTRGRHLEVPTTISWRTFGVWFLID